MSSRDKRREAGTSHQESTSSESPRRRWRRPARRVALLAVVALVTASATGLAAHSAEKPEVSRLTAGLSAMTGFTGSDDQLFFTAHSSEHGVELWKTDGTLAGTTIVKDIAPGRLDAFTSTGTYAELTDVDGTLFFRPDGPAGDNHIWKTDGTAEGTLSVTAGVDLGSTLPNHLANVRGTIFFTAGGNGHGRELWRTDGTPGGTRVVTVISPDDYGSHPTHLTPVGDTLYFIANDGTHGYEPWMSDGTPEGTVMVADLVPGFDSPEVEEIFGIRGGVVLQVAMGSTQELWRINGSAEDPTKIATFDSGADSTFFSRTTEIDGIAYFNVEVAKEEYALWRTDGTAAGTVQLKGGGAQVDHLVKMDGVIYFTGPYGDDRWALWRTDGTPSGTTVVKTGDSRWSPSYLTDSDGTLYFMAETPAHGRELWKSDGTAAGTSMVADFRPGSQSLNPANIHHVNGTLVFQAIDDAHFLQLWRLGAGGLPPVWPQPKPKPDPAPQPPMTKASTTSTAKVKVNTKKRTAAIQVKVTSKRSAKVTGKVRIRVARGKKTVRTVTVKVNPQGIAKTKVAKKFLKTKGVYKVTATYQGSSKHRASRTTAKFRIR